MRYELTDRELEVAKRSRQPMVGRREQGGPRVGVRGVIPAGECSEPLRDLSGKRIIAYGRSRRDLGAGRVL